MKPASETASGEPFLTELEIRAAIETVAREHLGSARPLAPDTRLVEDLELDSVRLLTLAIEVENRFQVCLDDDGELAIETVADLVAAVRRALAARDGRTEAG